MLILRPTKSGVKFEWSDDDSETVVTLDKSDDDETMVRKLRKVLSLAEPEDVAHPPRDKVGDVFRDAAKRSASYQQPANGWKKYEAPQVPDRLKGDVEMIEEGE